MSDEGLALTSDIRRRLFLWNARTGEVLKTREEPAQRGNLNLSPNGNHIIISGGVVPPSLLRFPSLELVFDIDEGRRNGVDYAFHPKEPRVMTQFVRGSLHAFNLENGYRSAPLGLSTPSTNSDLSTLVSQIEFAPDGNKLATADHTGRIRIWRH